MPIQPLLFRPFPKVDESWRGYILRVSEENVLSSPRTMLRYSQLSEENLRTTFPHINNMVALTMKSVETLNPIYPVNHKSNTYRMLGQTVPKAYLRVNSPMVCTECVKELGYIPALWDVVYMNICHKHKKHLIGECPSCKKKLKWYRQGLLVCHCGFNLSDTVGRVASPEEVNFSELLATVIERKKDFNVHQHNPIPVPFFTMSLSTLLGVFNTLGLTKLSLEENPIDYVPVGSTDVYNVGVEIFSNWTPRFKDLIKQNEIKNGNNELSVRKRHVNLYGSLFKKSYPENEIKYILDEFIKIAQSSETPVYVDNRIKSKSNSADKKTYKVGINEAAKVLGMMPSTLRKRVSSGKIQTQTINTKQGTERHFFNTDALMKLPNNKGELGLREAAAYVSLPVSVIKSLRESKHYHDYHKTVYPAGWAIPDMDDLISRVLAQGKQDSTCSDPISISKAMLMKFRYEDIKTEIIRGVLEARIRAFGPAAKIGDILISKTEVMQLTDSKRLETADYLKFSDVSKLIGIDQTCLKYIHEKQIFRTKMVNYITYINRKDVESFNGEYIALSRVAADHSLSPIRLLTQSELNGINLFQFERQAGSLQSFIRKIDQQKLLGFYFN
ncbi:MAG: TniQ family protein [Methylotenera sp.]|nr:TniQ family protein [Methylotenera sp.]